MGLVGSREEGTAEETETGHPAPTVYRYPPKSGSYFGLHFLMGGERFETGGTEGHYLFGENTDLNFLGARSMSLPYPAQPQTTEPTKTLQCLLNVRRDSLKFLKCENDPNQYNITFIFDCDVPITIRILYFATETADPVHGLSYSTDSLDLCSREYSYGLGAGQEFVQPEHRFAPGLVPLERLSYDGEAGALPIVIQCTVAGSGAPGFPPQRHVTYALVSESAEGTGWILKPLKQKLSVGGVAYLLQEIYGIENKNPSLNEEGERKGGEAGELGDLEENGADCVVCMSELRDTLILPCRHLCLCNTCADSLRYKASNCPICRSPFRALLQIKTLRRVRDGGEASASAAALEGLSSRRMADTASPGPLASARYEAISLIEALNGPIDHTQTCLSLPAAAATSPPPRNPAPPPRGHRHHRRRRHNPRTTAPIQEVLTPAAIPVSPTTSPEGQEMELQIRPTQPSSSPQPSLQPASPSSEGEDQETDSDYPEPRSGTTVMIINEDTDAGVEEHSAASSVGSHKALLVGHAAVASNSVDAPNYEEDKEEKEMEEERDQSSVSFT